MASKNIRKDAGHFIFENGKPCVVIMRDEDARADVAYTVTKMRGGSLGDYIEQILRSTNDETTEKNTIT